MTVALRRSPAMLLMLAFMWIWNVDYTQFCRLSLLLGLTDRISQHWQLPATGPHFNFLWWFSGHNVEVPTHTNSILRHTKDWSDKHTKKSAVYGFYLFSLMEPHYGSVYEISRARTCTHI
jgi:hypothetical protein